MSTGPFAVRRAIPDDAPRLSAIARLAKAHWGYAPEDLDAWRDQLTVTADYLSSHDGLVFVAEEPGRGAEGFGALAVADGAAEIDHLWVVPDRIGHGMGRALFERLMAAARDGGIAVVRIASDPNAEAFYRRMGAVRVGAQPAPAAGDPARVLPILEFRT